MTQFDRRTFIKSTAAVAAGSVLIPGTALSVPTVTTLFIIHGTDPAEMLRAGLAKLGGLEKQIKKGGKVTIKPNAAWASRPEQGGNTHPELVKACVSASLSAGAKEVVLPENPCTPADKAFSQSGIGKAAKQAGGKLFALSQDNQFQPLAIPRGKVLKAVNVGKDIVNTDFLINMPVVKSHSSATITVAMKNWMGAVQERKVWHSGQLHQCIADCSTAIKANLIIADATRVMMTNGPRGPGEMSTPNQIIIGTDPVAVDAYAATLFKMKPFDIEHIKIAHEMGIGCGDLTKIDLQHITL